jgi:hypothetical protein
MRARLAKRREDARARPSFLSSSPPPLLSIRFDAARPRRAFALSQPLLPLEPVRFVRLEECGSLGDMRCHGLLRRLRMSRRDRRSSAVNDNFPGAVRSSPTRGIGGVLASGIISRGQSSLRFTQISDGFYFPAKRR